MKKIIFPIAVSLLSFGIANAQIKNFDKPTDNYFEISKNLEIFTNIFKELNQNYVDPIEPGKMTKSAIDAMLYELDPYTNYFTETDKEEYQSQTAGKYGGIGINLMIIDSNVFIGNVFEGSPTDKSGIKTGDQLLKVDDVKITGKKEDEIGLMLRGAPGTKVELELKNANTNAVYNKSVTRESVELSAVPLYSLVGPKKDLAYVYLNQFTQNCSKDVKDALVDLKKQEPNLKGVILDLRGNPGGLLGEAVNICNLFIPKGQLVVNTKGRASMYDNDFVTQNEPWDLEIPLAVIINSRSASASEVVSGTIQDLDRGVVVGVKSFGKGLVQNVKSLGYNTSLKLTTAKYYTPSGRCIQALDYSHRNPDGSVSSVPDSLKRSFKTKNGRTVYDGGGVEPDIPTKASDVNRTLIALLSDGQIFDYATDYYYKHPTIASAEQFFVSDKEYKDFLDFMSKRDYEYKSGSEEMIDELETVLKSENYLDESREEIKALRVKIDAEKQNSINKSKDQIKQLLSNEIVGRYYYQKGQVLNRLYHSDEELDAAIKVLSNIENEYKPILK